MTNRHVFDHALAQRADGLVGHGVTPVSHEVANPMILRQDQPPRYAGLQCASCELSPGNLPRERFSSLAHWRHSGELIEWRLPTPTRPFKLPRGNGWFGSRLCENARDWRPDCVRSDTGEDFADRRGKISRIEPREHLMTF